MVERAALDLNAAGVVEGRAEAGAAAGQQAAAVAEAEAAAAAAAEAGACEVGGAGVEDRVAAGAGDAGAADAQRGRGHAPVGALHHQAAAAPCGGAADREAGAGGQQHLTAAVPQATAPAAGSGQQGEAAGAAEAAAALAVGGLAAEAGEAQSGVETEVAAVDQLAGTEPSGVDRQAALVGEALEAGGPHRRIEHHRTAAGGDQHRRHVGAVGQVVPVGGHAPVATASALPGGQIADGDRGAGAGRLAVAVVGVIGSTGVDDDAHQLVGADVAVVEVAGGVEAHLIATEHAARR